MAERSVAHWKANHRDAVRRKRVKDKVIQELRIGMKDLLERFKIVCSISKNDAELIKRIETLLNREEHDAT